MYAAVSLGSYERVAMLCDRGHDELSFRDAPARGHLRILQLVHSRRKGTATMALMREATTHGNFMWPNGF